MNFRRIRGRIVPIKSKKTDSTQQTVDAYDYAKGGAAGAAFAVGSKILKTKKFAYVLGGLTALSLAARAYRSKTPQEFAHNFGMGLVKKGVGFVGGAATVYGGVNAVKLVKRLKK